MQRLRWGVLLFAVLLVSGLIEGCNTDNVVRPAPTSPSASGLRHWDAECDPWQTGWYVPCDEEAHYDMCYWSGGQHMCPMYPLDAGTARYS
jgi:hypothetical protein